MSSGNFGDVKPVGNGVWEARIDWGPGYRVYYAQAGSQLILLLVGGDKRKQQSDIEQAQGFWADWQERKKACALERWRSISGKARMNTW